MRRYSHITAKERKLIFELLDLGCSMAETSRIMDRARSTIKRELERNGYRDQEGNFKYDHAEAHRRSCLRKALAGYGKGRRYCDLSRPAIGLYRRLELRTLPRLPYRAVIGRIRKRWIDGFRIRNKDLRKYCALTYYWKNSFGWIWRKKHKQKRYTYSQPPIFSPDRKNRKRPLFKKWGDHQGFRVWKKRKRKLKTYSWLEWDVMKMCRKKRIRKSQSLPRTPLIYQWPKRFWETEGDVKIPRAIYVKTPKLLDKRSPGLCEISVSTSKYGRGASRPEQKGRILKICSSFGWGQVHALQKMTA